VIMARTYYSYSSVSWFVVGKNSSRDCNSRRNSDRFKKKIVE
jgi:hypothetical protein